MGNRAPMGHFILAEENYFLGYMARASTIEQGSRDSWSDIKSMSGAQEHSTSTIYVPKLTENS